MDIFANAFADLHLLQHPFYQAWMAGELSRETLREYAVQYHHHVERFPRYISAIHSLTENADQRRQVLQNLNEEEGTGFECSHPELWIRFAEGLGVSREAVLAAEPGPAIRNVAATFFEYSRSSFHEGLGALYAYESQVPEIAESKIEGLKNRYGVEDARTLEFFEVHRKADVEHRRAVREMLESLPEDQQRAAKDAARAAARSLWDFLTEMHGKQAACA